MMTGLPKGGVSGVLRDLNIDIAQVHWRVFPKSLPVFVNHNEGKNDISLNEGNSKKKRKHKFTRLDKSRVRIAQP